MSADPTGLITWLLEDARLNLRCLELLEHAKHAYAAACKHVILGLRPPGIRQAVARAY